MPKLFEPLTLRSITLRNRIGVAPMCMFSAVDGLPNAWHMSHLGSRATGGAGLVIAEATAVEARGRISANDVGLWNDAQVEAWKPIVAFIESQGAVPAVQIAHAGRKSEVPDSQSVAPSAVTFSDHYQTPQALSIDEIQQVIEAWQLGARRAIAAGFKSVEIHAAHGYLLHQFLSPFSNQRDDEYGGSFENRIRIVKEVTQAVRAEVPGDLPLLIRFSCTDWVEGGWDLPQTIALSKELKPLGVDLVDCSTGGNLPSAPIPVGPGYQVPFAEAIRKEAGLPTAAVGLITEPKQAEQILDEGKADLILLARQFLRDPYWPRTAALELGAEIVPPRQYGRGWLSA